ncbi:MAG: hypothetical protein LBP92_01110 [Deltaproteobacteria bacterium]|jgi:ABC-type nitrate/sulfonate/bicarbonate transport system substrate-binding protein|nr:hypothetical protein [Deltaproteobacteria bacterium]
MNTALSGSALAAALAALLALLAGPAARGAEMALKIGHTGPIGGLVILVAAQNGYFSEEGLSVVPVPLAPTDLDGLPPSALAALVTNHEFARLVRRDIGARASAGLYGGLLEILGLGARPGRLALAVDGLGSGPAVAAARHFRGQGLDPLSDVDFLDRPGGLLRQAMESGEANALARWEKAWPGQADGDGQPRHSPGQAGDPGGLSVIFRGSDRLPKPRPGTRNPHSGHVADSHLFEAFVVLFPDNYGRDDETSAAVSRALIRGARWIGRNLAAAAGMAKGNGLLPGDAEGIAAELSGYMWMPGVGQARDHLKSYAHEWLARGIVEGKDEGEVFGRMFLEALPGLD